jgi:predicted ATPase
MRLINFYVSDYKNLKGFTIDFFKESFLEVFVGRNGSGKSNFIEALIDVFRHIYEYDFTDRYEVFYDYKLHYEIEGEEIIIEFNVVTSQLKVNGVNRKTIGKTATPENILIYYAGHNQVVNDLLEKYEAKFSSIIKTQDELASRKFIGIDNSYNELFLTVMLLLPKGSPSQQFILDKLGVESFNSALKINLKRPSYAKHTNSKKYDVSDGNEYWGLEGVSKGFLKILENCNLPNDQGIRTEGYLADKDEYQLYCSLDLLRKALPEYNALHYFRALDNFKTLEMLSGLTMSFKINGGSILDSYAFSDGQFQAIYLFAISEIFKNTNCITLMDEPDSFLHPEWQADCSEQVQALSDEATASNHVLMTTHSAVTLINSPHKKVRYFDIVKGRAKTYCLPKREAVRRLCSNIIEYTEQEQILSILNAIDIEKKPVLFTEGSTDPLILKAAWYKLYPDVEIPFIPFYAFSCSYINQLITDNRVHNEMDGRNIFALFDFDEAYNQWNSLNGNVLQDDVSNGLIKKWDGGNAYAMMLPIPRNKDIQEQVFQDELLNKHFEGKSYCMIEHLLYGVDETEDYFNKQAVPGGNLIKFNGCKTTFAKTIVPSLPQESFEPFRKMFEFITDICA